MATAKEEKQFEKQMAAEKKARYLEMKEAGTLPVLAPEQIRYNRRKKFLGVFWPIFRFLILFGLCFVILYPLLFMLSTAFRPNDQMNDPTIIWIPKSLTKANIEDVWNLIDYPVTLGRTLALNIGSAVLQVLMCAITGYGFARFNFKGRNALFMIVVLMIIIPPQITVIPLFLQYAYFNLFGIGSLLSTTAGQDYISLIGNPIVMYAPAFFSNGIRAGLFILVFRQFFRGLPKELEDAAYLDGCGPFKTFIKVMVPNAKSSFLTVFLFSVVWYWNDYYVSTSFFNKGDTIALALMNLSATLNQQLFEGRSVGMRQIIVWLESGCILAVTPVLIMYIFLQRYFIEGVERSGLVG